MAMRHNYMDEILDFLKYKMTIDEVAGDTRITKVTGTINPPVDRTISEIKDYVSTTEYTPIFDSEGKQHVIKFGIFKKAEEKPKYWLNVLLFVATVVSTTFAGYLHYGNIFLGLLFSLSIMAILTCHEFGHYFVSKREGMITSLPYFIPLPGHIAGTLGAIIRMKSIVPSRSSLLKVGMAGPISGFLVALPITIIGIALSKIMPAPESGVVIKMGDSLLFLLLVNIIHPQIPQDAGVFLHPMAFAGWLGFLVTSINLLPIGQLDGGHVSYSVYLKNRKYLYIPVFAGLVALSFLFIGWLFVVLLALFVARRDPIIQDSLTPLTNTEKLYALFILIIFIITFIPQPIILG